jgi:hypothetical protein
MESATSKVPPDQRLPECRVRILAEQKHMFPETVQQYPNAPTTIR